MPQAKHTPPNRINPYILRLYQQCAKIQEYKKVCNFKNLCVKSIHF